MAKKTRSRRKPADRKEQITQVEAAKRLGRTPQAIGQWVARAGAPVVVRGSRKLLIWPDFPIWRETEMEKQVRDSIQPKSPAGSRLEEAKARLAELEVAKAEGRLIEVEVAIKKVEAMLAQLRAQLLTMPQRWAPLLVNVTSLQAATAKLEEAVIEAMRVLSGAVA